MSIPRNRVRAELLPFLNHLCQQRPALEIYITAWDYSVVYALEREWLQKLRFDFQSHPRVHFEFLPHPEPGGCHHQKLVVIDGRVAFLGGLDLCDARWDTRQHAPHSPERVDTHGRPYKPFHDIQVALTGPVVDTLQRLFLDGWRLATGSELSGAHNSLLPEVTRLLREQGAGDILVFAGGIIPEQDIAGLKGSGVDEIFLPGTSTKAIVEYLQHRLVAA